MRGNCNGIERFWQVENPTICFRKVRQTGTFIAERRKEIDPD